MNLTGPITLNAHQRLVLLGPPCSGKGTAATWLTRRFHIPHLSTGAIFREQIAVRNEMGKLVNRFVSKGELVPDEMAFKVVDHWMKEHTEDGFVSDGFPRTLVQAKFFQNLLSSYGVKLDRVIYLNISQAVAEKRVLGRLVCKWCGQNFHVTHRPPKKEGVCDVCGGLLLRRGDDALKTLQQRWAVFENQTAGLVSFYRNLGILYEVDANGELESMCQMIWETIVK